jgi:hypothetical protein
MQQLANSSFSWQSNQNQLLWLGVEGTANILA